MAGRLITLVALATCMTAAPALTFAQLADPTRPPAEIMSPVADAGADATPTSHRLQSVILKKGGRPAALINGTLVELGGKIGESRLVEVKEDAVALLGPEGRQVLRLMPDAEKQLKVGAGDTANPEGKPALKGEKRK